MDIRIPYGNSVLPFSHKNVKRIVASRIGDLQSELSEREIVKKAMSEPIDSERLCALAQGKKRAVIIISDHTRPVPSKVIIPLMLEELRKDNPSIDITLLVATGCHRETTRKELVAKLGEEIVSSEKIVVHDCDDEENLINMGQLPSGADLIVNKIVCDCDLLIAEGFIEPHFFAGFSGGRKSILPGICSRTTVLGNHCSQFIDNPQTRMGILDGNPINDDMLEAVKLVNLKYIVNVIIDSEKKVVAAFAGDSIRAHRKGCDFLLSYCKVSCEEKADIVITSNGGAPLDQNVYQAVKGMTTGEAFNNEGGVIIICAQCEDGIGGDFFYKKMIQCASVQSLLEEIRNTPMNETVPDQWQYQILARILDKHHVILVCDEKLRSCVEEMKMTFAASLEEGVEKAFEIVGENSEIIVIPDGVSVIAI